MLAGILQQTLSEVLQKSAVGRKWMDSYVIVCLVIGKNSDKSGQMWMIWPDLAFFSESELVKVDIAAGVVTVHAVGYSVPNVAIVILAFKIHGILLIVYLILCVPVKILIVFIINGLTHTNKLLGVNKTLLSVNVKNG